MESLKKSKIFIDKEAYITLSMIKAGFLSPIDKLMNKKEAKIANEKKLYKNQLVPFSFILAPSGKKNQEILKNNPKYIDLIYNNKKVGEIDVEEIYEIDIEDRLKTIYGSSDYKTYPHIAKTKKRLGKYAIAGEFRIDNDEFKKQIDYVREITKDLNNITAMTMHAKPIHRVHEKIMRMSIEKSDILIIFLIKNLKESDISYQTRYEILQYLVDKFFPKDKIIIVPLINTYIFSGINEAIIDAIIAKNFNATKFIIGQTHEGLGIHYEANNLKSIFDSMNLNIEIETINEYVYCDECKTIVSVNSCPHGSHHHISYHSDSILELLKTGIIPPPILMRKEISAKFLASMFKNRFNNLEKLYYDISPHTGLIKKSSEEEFYIALMNLYQTTSLS